LVFEDKKEYIEVKMKNRNYLDEEIVWDFTEDPEKPYQANHDGKRLLIRLNDFPAEHLYTLFVDDQEIASFDDLAISWKYAAKPPLRKAARSVVAKAATRGAGRAKASVYSARKG
jgi:hypothetical protein